jgi:hypothetical protein
MADTLLQAQRPVTERADQGHFRAPASDFLRFALQPETTGMAVATVQMMQKHQVRDNSLFMKIASCLISNVITQHAFTVLNMVARLDPPGIVFPFHSFW